MATSKKDINFIANFITEDPEVFKNQRPETKWSHSKEMDTDLEINGALLYVEFTIYWDAYGESGYIGGMRDPQIDDPTVEYDIKVTNVSDQQGNPVDVNREMITTKLIEILDKSDIEADLWDEAQDRKYDGSNLRFDTYKDRDLDRRTMHDFGK